jgi:hypothetical protein
MYMVTLALSPLPFKCIQLYRPLMSEARKSSGHAPAGKGFAKKTCFMSGESKHLPWGPSSWS